MNRSGTQKKRLLRLLGVAFWIVLWAIAAAQINKPLVFAGPVETFRALISLAATPSFWQALALTVNQILGGFFVAFIGALLLGMLANHYVVLRAILHPFMNFLKSVPVVCIIVILLLWMGSAAVAPVVVILMVLPAYYFTIVSSLADKRSEESSGALTASALRLMGVGPLKRFLSEGWAYLLPYLKATSSSVVGMAWKAGVAAQLIGLSVGTLGEAVFQAKALIEAPMLFALTISIVLCAFISEQVWLVLLGASKYLFIKLALVLPSRSANASSFPCGDGKDVVSATPLFSVEHVSVWRGEKRVLDDLSLSVPPSVVIMGASGLGKTTLCETLLGLIRPDKGSVCAPSRVGLVFQQPTLVLGLTVKQNLALIARKANLDSDKIFSEGEDVSKTEKLPAGKKNPAPSGDALMKECGDLLKDINGNQKAEELSGGQLRRVELVRALLAPAPALLLDEPFTGLDEQSKKGALELLSKYLQQTNKPLLLVSHDKADAQTLNLDVIYLSGTTSKRKNEAEGANLLSRRSAYEGLAVDH